MPSQEINIRSGGGNQHQQAFLMLIAATRAASSRFGGSRPLTGPVPAGQNAQISRRSGHRRETRKIEQRQASKIRERAPTPAVPGRIGSHDVLVEGSAFGTSGRAAALAGDARTDRVAVDDLGDLETV